MRPTALDVLLRVFGPIAVALVYLPLALAAFVVEHVSLKAHQRSLNERRHTPTH